MSARKIDAIPVLTDPAFLAQMRGGLYVGFSGENIRNAVSMGWIEDVTMQETRKNIAKSVIIFLRPVPIVKKGINWRKSNRTSVKIDLLRPVEHISLIDGGERHFTPDGQNHFSVYIEEILLKSDSGLYTLVQYEKMYRDAKLITQR